MLTLELLTITGSCIQVNWRYEGARGREVTGEAQFWTDEHMNLQNGLALLRSGCLQLLIERLEAATKPA